MVIWDKSVDPCFCNKWKTPYVDIHIKRNLLEWSIFLITDI